MLNNQVDPLILSHRANLSSGPFTTPKDWSRPFVETSTANPLSITESQTKVVEFMEEDESMGEVYVVWLGASPTDYRSNLAIKLIGNYLTQSATAPLQKEFIEIPKPYTTAIGIYSEDKVIKNELQMVIYDVPAKHLNDIADLVKAKLAKIVKHEGIDMERMGLILRRDKRKLLNVMETSVSSVLADAVIGGEISFVSHDSCADCRLSLRHSGRSTAACSLRGTGGLRRPGELHRSGLAQPSRQVSLSCFRRVSATDIGRYFVSPPSLTVIGKPSAALSTKIESDEKERIAKRKAELGEEKLKELERKVEEAKKESDVPPPPEMIGDFPLTDVSPAQDI